MAKFYEENYTVFPNNRNIYIGGKDILHTTKAGIYSQNRNKTNFYSLKGATSALRDREGNQWFSTEHNGIYKLSSSNFSNHKIEKYVKDGEVPWVLKGLGENVFLATKNGGIYKYSIKKDSISRVVTERNSLYKKGSALYDFSVLNNKLYVGLDIEIKMSDMYCKLKNTAYYPYISANQLSNGKIVAWDRNIIAYFDNIRGLNRSDISLIDKNCNLPFSDKKKYGYGIKKAVKFNEGIQSLTLRKNQVLFETRSDFYAIDSFNQLQTVTNTYNLADKVVYMIDTFMDDMLVLATNRGVGLIKENKTRWLTTKDGLPSNMIYTAISGNNKTIWCATQKGGVSRIKFLDKDCFNSKLIVENFSKENGLHASIEYMIKHQKSIYAISNNGLIIFPDSITLTQAPLPKVHLIKWKQDGKNLSMSHQTFPCNSNSIEIEYLGIAMQKPIGRPFYRYKLVKDGEKSDWTLTDNRTVAFNQLSSGEYTFCICARNINDQWTEPKLLTFSIRPHWTGLWWIHVLFWIVVGIALYFYYKRDLKKRQAAFEEKLALAELKEKLNSLELAVLRGQMNPHFIYNVLNSIQKLLLKSENKKANIFINKLATLFRSSLEYSRLSNIRLEQELTFLDKYLEIETHRFRDRFTYKITVDKKLDDDLLMPPLMIQPLCENAIKHAYSGKSVHILVEFQYLNPHYFQVLITDTGLGYYQSKRRENNDQKTSLGLDIIKRRVALLKEKFIDTHIDIEPLNKTTKSGTLIKLILPMQ